MTLIGNSEGKLHVQRQVEDYALQGNKFEEMGFLSFTVETYERRLSQRNVEENTENDNTDISLQSNTDLTNPNCRYLFNHPRSKTHYCIHRSENHNSLPNIVGPWLPRRDGEDDSKPYYYASMLAFLKPWRNLHQLKSYEETWETAYNLYMESASQRDKDVVAGCQYYYESKNVAMNRNVEEEIEATEDHFNDNNNNEMDIDDESQFEPTVCFFVLLK